jgi:SAM-dependent methyltransferase
MNNQIEGILKGKYRVEDGIPIFIDSVSSSFNPSRLCILSPPDTTWEVLETRKHDIITGSEGFILNVGSCSKRYPGAINLDIEKFDNVDVVADAKDLPFKSNVFDAVLMESVLEHIDEPEKAIKESYRVLRKGGKIYISIPFVFVFHNSPSDYNRYTINGLVARLKKEGFKDIQAGIVSGAGSTMNQMLRYYLALLFSFNSKFLFSLMLNVFGWVTFLIKYTDIILNKYRMSSTMASVIWASGVKR